MVNKSQIMDVTIEDIKFPNKGIAYLEDKTKLTVKNSLPGQRLRVRAKKKRKNERKEKNTH